jgi:hypothetical protein
MPTAGALPAFQVHLSSIHKHFGCRIEDTQTNPASGRSLGIFGNPLRWRIALIFAQVTNPQVFVNVG